MEYEDKGDIGADDVEGREGDNGCSENCILLSTTAVAVRTDTAGSSGCTVSWRETISRGPTGLVGDEIR